MRPQRSSSGSAFVTDTEKRHIMTNSHVVSLSALQSAYAHPLVQSCLILEACVPMCLSILLNVSNIEQWALRMLFAVCSAPVPGV